MYCPSGFKLIQDIEDLAEQITNNRFPFPTQVTDEDDYENYVETNSQRNDWFVDTSCFQNRLVDEFLRFVPEIWICSPNGTTLRVAKKAIGLPPTSEWFDDLDYFRHRFSAFAYIDLALWVIDPSKERDQFEHLIDSGLIHGEISDYEPTERVERLRNFIGWSVCISEKHFPTSHTDLTALIHEETGARNTKGRPRIQDDVLKAYNILFPSGHGRKSIKEVLKALDKVGVTSSERTLRRALEMAKT